MEEEASSAEAAWALAPLETWTEAVLMDWLARSDFAGDGADLGNGAGEAGDHGGERLHQLVLGGALADRNREIAAGDLLGRSG